MRLWRSAVTVATLVGAAAVALISFVLAGYGHGWPASMFSAASIILAPAGGFAWLLRPAPWCRRVAIAAVIGFALLDGWILAATAGEGWNSLESAWTHFPALVVAWFVVFVGIQIPALAALRRS